jgi:hypothetical protein
MSPLQAKNNLTSHPVQQDTDLLTFIKQARDDLEWEKFVASAKLEASIETLCTDAKNEQAAKSAKLNRKHEDELVELRKRQAKEWEELRERERLRFEEVVREVGQMRHEFERGFEERKMELEGVIEEQRWGAGDEMDVVEEEKVVEERDEVMVWRGGEWSQFQRQNRAEGMEAQEKERRSAEAIRRVQEERRRFKDMAAALQKFDGVASDAFPDTTAPTRLSSPCSSDASEDRCPLASPMEAPTLSSPSPTPPEYQQHHQETLDIPALITALKPHIPT